MGTGGNKPLPSPALCGASILWRGAAPGKASHPGKGHFGSRERARSAAPECQGITGQGMPGAGAKPAGKGAGADCSEQEREGKSRWVLGGLRQQRAQGRELCGHWGKLGAATFQLGMRLGTARGWNGNNPKDKAAPGCSFPNSVFLSANSRALSN